MNWIQQLRLYFENIDEFVKRPVDERIARRVVQVFGNNMKGDAVLICRYLCAQEPPPGIKSFHQALKSNLFNDFLENRKVDIENLEQQIKDNKISAFQAAESLLFNY